MGQVQEKKEAHTFLSSLSHMIIVNRRGTSALSAQMGTSAGISLSTHFGELTISIASVAY